MVPLLSLNRCDLRAFRELIGCRSDQRQLTFLRQHQQQILIGQQHELLEGVALALPAVLA